MEYIGYCIATLWVSFLIGITVADHKLATLRVEIGVVVKKQILSYAVPALGGAWGGSFHCTTRVLKISTVRGEIVPIFVSRSQYDEIPMETTISAKYWESRFLKDKTLLDFTVLES
ncbi:MAG: hypothetical protein Q8R36_00810 [bacterium]|nr:hypothetical protein [bacterium]